MPRLAPGDLVRTAQRAMSERAGSTVVEATGSYSIYVSQPAAVADLIRSAGGGAHV